MTEQLADEWSQNIFVKKRENIIQYSKSEFMISEMSLHYGSYLQQCFFYKYMIWFQPLSVRAETLFPVIISTKTVKLYNHFMIALYFTSVSIVAKKPSHNIVSMITYFWRLKSIYSSWILFGTWIQTFQSYYLEGLLHLEPAFYHEWKPITN